MSLFQGDCLDIMKNCIAESSIDMVLCDLPYGTTACKWDIIIPFEPLWECLNRVIKPGGCIALFGSEPFSSLLRVSNLKKFKYDWIWNKKLAGNAIVAQYQPLKIHEIISIFNTSRYFPQKTVGKKRKKMTSGIRTGTTDILHGDYLAQEYESDLYYPVTIQEFSTASRKEKRVHPTQKPVELCEFLIKTYSLEGETVLDCCAGSGTTGVACQNTNRQFVLIEKDPTYFKIMEERLHGNRA